MKLKTLVPDLWEMTFPLTLLGVDLQRNVTILRLSSGKLLIHSTAPFTDHDISVIRELGEPAWIADVLLRHDTFAREGTAAFPGLPYLVPDGFEAEGVSFQPLIPPPAEWAGEIEVLAVEGVPSFGEIVMFHKASRTLVVGDLLFNFSDKSDLFTKALLAIGSVHGKYDPGITRPFAHAIEDRGALAASLGKILEWDFDRIIVGHGDPIHSGGKELLRETFRSAGVVEL
ncbi:MAG: hypothetical protein EOP85_20810 [Verrucomicrobiaceae bacterium]|nr:MAG: hypothetical protein EOP85_20810 [Verrucomicrobiaceae bacterium]